jgi:predicted MFS family arabinose efflux permease
MLKSNPNEPPEYGGTNQKVKLPLHRQALEYLLLLRRNPKYRVYLMSHICQHVGDWYIRIASLLTLTRLAPGSATAISVLLLVKTLPHVVCSQLGGALADSLDRRRLLIALDLLGALATLGFLLALHHESLVIFYVFAGVRATVHALYEPTTKALLPMLVESAVDLKRAATINQLAWATMLALGGVVAGTTSAFFGLAACYIFDSITYFLSAVILGCLLRGDFKVEHHQGPSLERLYSIDPDAAAAPHYTIAGRILRIFHPLYKLLAMIYTVIIYLWACGFGMVVFLKASGAAVWGAADILNTEYAYIPGDEAATARRLGFIFSSIGLGCVLGPVVGNVATDANRPMTMQRICIFGLLLEGIGYLGWSQSTNSSFGIICLFSGIRAIGSSLVYMNATLILQELSLAEILGRVLGTEYALYQLSDAIIAVATGRLLDQGVSKERMSVGVAILAVTLFCLWSLYHTCGLGAARQKFNRPHEATANVQFA